MYICVLLQQTLLDVFPAVKDSLLYLIVDHAGDEGVLFLEDVPEHLDKALGAALLQQHLEDPVNRHEIESRNVVCLDNCHILGWFHTFNCVSGEIDCLRHPFGASSILMARDGVVLCSPEAPRENSRQDLEICLQERELPLVLDFC